MNYRTRIKMCGTTNIDDATAAVHLGVDALGFIFVQKSPRYISPEEAKEIVDQLPPFVFKVGVFVDESLQEINEIARYVGLSGIQLHGNEEPAFCAELAASLPSCFLLKAFRVGKMSCSEDFRQYNEVVNGFLLDTYVDGKEGGTGLPFDWSIIKKLKLRLPVILAGGLNPENIEKALETACPFAVDVNSGVEHSPGRKDHLKLKRLVLNLEQYNKSVRSDG